MYAGGKTERILSEVIQRSSSSSKSIIKDGLAIGSKLIQVDRVDFEMVYNNN